ncbi:protein kinase subdomain-containing protein PKL [Coprinopsis cinerea okayama7|uniref:Protein kinase subdomain-containing protein PKL n=1 Tax=Coprinopsis cinerea (strain Okayama-7 / 130 / ATCC MYA-4618 / FGSC 9003) TaxID=240176 RepID=A8N7W3_COPC7|nr:protein kinase subdomain-containing protein PKL [Coprinopsis cinerea okayama7\|eukprot:XP_001830919.2 protein kinase subdomain-containing protein PKL [Coprinopsis cinerea okayama7\
MKVLPRRIKRLIYRSLCALSNRWGWRVHPVLHHLPFGLALRRKTSFSTAQHSSAVEAAGLKYLESSNIQGVNFPHLVDITVDGDTAYTLSTYIDGDSLASVLDHFTSQDWERLVLDLRSQLRSLRQQTTCESQRRPVICNAAGSTIIDDPRISWVAENGRELATTQGFFSQVWLGLDLPRNINTIRPKIQPLIDRPVSVNFCHGDVYPRNIILPGGLSAWRRGKSRLCLVDWEYSGWMPAPWEALKATLMECEEDSEWLVTIRKALPEFKEYLDADWEWRSKSNMMIV